MKIRWLMVGIALFICAALCRQAFSAPQQAKVIVHADKDLGNISNLLYGNNLVAYDPASYEGDWNSSWEPFYDYRLFGAGIWDTEKDKPVSNVIRLIREAGVSSLRFPGGCGVHHYEWKKTIDPFRTDFLFGLDEFMTVCERAGVEPVITLSYFTGTPQDAADMVEYLNMPDNGGYSWARKRAEYGRKAPYGVKYFEIGNEVWHGDHRTIGEVTPEEYATRYLEYYAAVKAVDPTVKVGAVFLERPWAEAVLGIIGPKIDFGIVHLYPTAIGVTTKDMTRMLADELFYMALTNAAELDKGILEDMAILVKEKTGKNVPLAITEYNANFMQDNPVPYRHSLGAALVNAEMLRYFMKPDNRVFMAHFWNLINEYWGMAANGFDGKEKNLGRSYYKRPNFYVFELYTRHFGDVLLDAEVESPEFSRYETSVPFISVNASRSRDGRTVYIILVNKEMRNSMPLSIDIMQARTARSAVVWTLSGPDVSATNENAHDTVKISRKQVRVTRYPYTRKAVINLELPAHSITAIELKKR